MFSFGDIMTIDFKEKEIIMARVKALFNGKEKFALVETYGCQQNVNDSQKYEGILQKMGYTLTPDREKADFIMFNTCAVRENAEKKVFGNIGALKHLKAKKPDLVIAIAGCMSQQEDVSKKLKSKYPHVDMILGTRAMAEFPALLERVLLEEKCRVVERQEIDCICENVPTNYDGGCKAFVSIMYGCNNFCTYCIVPYVRGRERSRSLTAVLDECRFLAEKGVKEITLLGQNVNSYGKDLGMSEGFATLLSEVDKIEGIERIRFMSSHPKDISDKVLEVMANGKRICHQLHLPLQSGSDKLLKEMNRVYNREKYLSIVNKAKALMPDLAITTDIIVGFPTETEEDFEDTISMLETVKYDSIFSFIYSKREGTPAAKMDFVATEAEIKARFDRLLEVQNAISYELNKKCEGEIQQVLVEGVSKEAGVLTGRNYANKIVNFSGDESLVGQIIKVKITRAQTWILLGEVCE